MSGGERGGGGGFEDDSSETDGFETGGSEMTRIESDADMERLLRETFDARARQAVPDDRRPPVIEWVDAPRARRPWVAPLAVAAAVAVLGAGVQVGLLQHRTPVSPPAAQSSTVSSTPGPTGSGTPSSVPSTAPVTAPPVTGGPTGSAPTSGTPSTAGTTSPGGRTIAFDGATLVVPGGWSARQDTGDGTPRVCLDPVGSSGCAVQLYRLDPALSALDPNTEGGYSSNPHYCNDGYTERTLTDYHDVTFGGRGAEFRSWVWACPEGTRTSIAQYTVVTPRSFALFSDKVTPAVTSLMAQVVASATLPPATSTTRLYDNGSVTSAVRQADGSTVIQVDRVAIGWPNQSTAVYSYRVPSGVTFTMALDGQAVAVPGDQLRGRTVTLETDGTVVTSGVVTSS